MDTPKQNRKKSESNVTSKRRILSEQKLKKLEKLGFDPDLLDLIHNSWLAEKKPAL